MKEILIAAKKIRNKLLFFIDEELKKNSIKNNSFLIDSKSPNELSKKYQNFSDYRMQISETYNGNQRNHILNTNFFHVAVTYTSINKNYKIWIENKENINSDVINDINRQIVEEIGKKEKKKYEKEKNYYNGISKDNKKRIIGNKKFSDKRKKGLCSSIEIPKKSIIIMEENNNSDNIHNNKKEIDKLENDKNNKEQNETVCANKKRKLKVNYYENKLKKYCSSLIILKKRRQKKYKKNFTLKQENQPTIETPFKKYKDSKDKTETRHHNSIKSQTKHHKSKIKEKVKLNKISEKKNHRRYRAQSIKDTHLFMKMVKTLPKKVNSPKKMIHLSTVQFDQKNREIISQKIARKQRDKNLEEIDDVRKMVSGGVKSKRKMFANKSSLKWNNNNNNNNKMIISVSNEPNNMEQQHNQPQIQSQHPLQLSNRRSIYKRANTLNKAYNLFHFKGNEPKSKDN